MNDNDSTQLPLLDHEILAELRDIMENEFANLIDRFLQDLPVQLNLLQDAVCQNSATQVHRIAHKLKSSCGNLGATRLTEWTRRLEQAGRQNTLDGVAEMLKETHATAEETMIELRALLN